MLKIRLQRVGRKHEPAFRLVLTESKNSTKSGRFKEVLGSYDPRKRTEALKADRIKHWLSMGVGITPTINNLLIKKGVIRGKKIDVSARSTTPQTNADITQTNAEAETAQIPVSEPLEPESDNIKEVPE